MSAIIKRAVQEAIENIEHQTGVISRLASLEHNELTTTVLEIFENEERAQISVSDSSIYLYVVMSNLDGFKDERLVDAIDRLMLCADWETETQDWAASLNRDFKFSVTTTREDGKRIWNHVTIAAYARSDSPTCRKVVVGQETKVVDKYEIICS